MFNTVELIVPVSPNFASKKEHTHSHAHKRYFYLNFKAVRKGPKPSVQIMTLCSKNFKSYGVICTFSVNIFWDIISYSCTSHAIFVYPCRFNDFSQKFAMQWRRRFRPHKVYIFLISITRRDLAIVSTQTEAIGMKPYKKSCSYCSI